MHPAEPTRSPCSICNQSSILNEHFRCADCEREHLILTHTGSPLYLLTESLSVLTILTVEPFQLASRYSYLVTVKELSSPFQASLEHIYFTPFDAAMAGLHKANDSILRLLYTIRNSLTPLAPSSTPFPFKIG